MNVFGNRLKVTVFGASHESQIGLVVDGFPEGVTIDFTNITNKLALRRGLGNFTSSRLEPDEFSLVSGYFDHHTTGAPLTFLIKNQDVKSEDYEINRNIVRPSHGDYPLYEKYHGFHDYRGGGTGSGRLTVALIVLGAICEQLLKEKQILVCSRVLSLGDIKDDANSLHFHQAQILCQEPFPVVHEEAKKNMMKAIEEAKNNQDSLGAIIQTSAYHLPVGLGNPFFDSFESILSHLLFSIPGVKGVEFGLGFDLARMFGSQANDQMAYEDGKVSFYTNHAGGINGGLTNGNPLVFQTAFRPTPSIGKAQNTIDVKNHTNKELHIKGRHDVVFAIKGLHVINAITNYAILEMLLEE